MCIIQDECSTYITILLGPLHYENTLNPSVTFTFHSFCIDIYGYKSYKYNYYQYQLALTYPLTSMQSQQHCYFLFSTKEDFIINIKCYLCPLYISCVSIYLETHTHIQSLFCVLSRSFHKNEYCSRDPGRSQVDANNGI